MSQIDKYLIEELKKQLATIKTSWCAIRISSEGQRCSEDSARGKIERLFMNSVVPWARSVVDAFGLEAFPTHCGEPKLPPEEADCKHCLETMPQAITGVGEEAAAGLRIILWAAAHQKPELLIQVKSRWDEIGFRASVKEWVESSFIVNAAGIWCSRQEPLDWVGMALDSLVVLWQESGIDDGIQLTIEQITQFLFNSATDTDKRRVRDWIEKGKIKAIKRGEGRATCYFVSRSVLNFMREIAKNEAADCDCHASVVYGCDTYC